MAKKTPSKSESKSEPQEKSTQKANPEVEPSSADKTEGKKDFLVVGMGASAGGIKPIQEFFATMPPNSGMAFVVILHLSPEHESNLREIIQAQTTMPVVVVNETQTVEPNRIYVIPPNRQLEMVDGVVRSIAPGAVRGSRVAIDIFFRTLAEVYHSKAVCVILSGSGTDGTLGLKAIKEANGFAIVQDPNEAEYDSMPRSAIATQLVDWVMPIKQMPERLLHFRDSSERLHLTQGDDGKVATEIQADESLRQILTILRVRTGHDFSNYKTPTLVRRIARHLQIHDLEDIPSYLKFLREKPDEIQSLLKNLLINVTNFFRDKAAWEALGNQVVPNLFAGKDSGDTIRVWSCGCASGEEAYSLAILLTEHAQQLPDPPKIQIFATDVDEDAITAARENQYPQSIEADVSPERLKRFFVKEGELYRLKKEIRELILFAPHNVLRDPPFSRLDLVVCRNLLIYLNRETQEWVMEIFHFALNTSGYLFLGSSETAEGVVKLFAPVDKKQRIYACRPVRTSQMPVPQMPLVGRWEVKPQEMKSKKQERPFSLGEVHYKLLEAIAPPSVLINQDFDVLYMSERAGRYLRFKGGEPSNNLLKLINPALLPDLRAALFSAQRDHKSSEFHDVRAVIDGAHVSISILVRAVEVENEPSDYLLVVLDEKQNVVKQDDVQQPTGRPPDKGGAMESVVLRLEEELARSKEQLRTTIEQHDTSVEELKASNEELQAINEELRSTSEELETSKEELQSLNEELTTVNQELKERVEETSRTNSDLQNLIASTDIATIFLDRKLCIKRFTPLIEQLFNITSLDIGRPLEHFTHRLDYANLSKDAAEVLRRLKMTEREVRDDKNRTFLTRFVPYRTVDDRIEGVVLNFVDITERKHAEEIVAAALRDTQILRDLSVQLSTEGDPQMMYYKILEAAIALTQANAGTIQLYDKKAQELVLLATKNFSPQMVEHFTRVNSSSLTSCGAALATGERTFVDFDAPDAEDPDGALKMHAEAGYLSAQSTPLIARSGKPIGIVSTHWRGHYRPPERELYFLDLLARQAADLIEQRMMDEAQREFEERLRLVMDTVRDYAIITCGDNGAINSWNVGAEIMFGWTAAEAIGQPTAIIFTPEDRAAGVPQQEMQKAAEQGRAEDERWHLRKDGSQFYASGVMTSLRRGDAVDFIKITRDLTERKQLEEQLRNSRDHLESRIIERTAELKNTNEDLQSEINERRVAEERIKELLRRIVSTQEIERRRIARDLHDHLGQQLTALNLSLESVKKQTEKNETLSARIEQIQAVARQIDSDVDFLTWELRPAELSELGLSAALENFVQEWSKHFAIEAEFHAANLKLLHLPSEMEINLYRIAQEALNNIVKHAEANRVSVLLERRNESIVLVIEDNGKGFKVPDFHDGKGIGLLSMRERASLIGGTLEIESTEGQGTSIYVRVPVKRLQKG